MTDLSGVQPGELDYYWPIAEKLLRPALEHGSGYRWTMPAVREAIAKGQKQLWLTPNLDLAIVTSIEVYPLMKVLCIFLVGGVLPPDWPGIVALLEQWGKSEGCSEVDTGGRKGWVRKYPPGYEQAPWVQFIKVI